MSFGDRKRAVLLAAAILHTLVIFALVPTGRWIERMLLDIKSAYPVLFSSLVLVSAGLLFSSAIALFTFVSRRSGNLSAFSLFGACLVVLCPLAILKPAAIELAHVLMFALLAFLVRLVSETKARTGHTNVEWRASGKALLIAFIIAFVDELLQGIHPRRFFDPRDLGIDLIGILCGVFIARPWTRTSTETSSSSGSKSMPGRVATGMIPAADA